MIMIDSTIAYKKFVVTTKNKGAFCTELVFVPALRLI